MVISQGESSLCMCACDIDVVFPVECACECVSAVCVCAQDPIREFWPVGESRKQMQRFCGCGPVEVDT